MKKSSVQYKENIEKYLESSHWHQALQECLEFQDLYPDNSEINYYLAQVYFGMKDMVNAEREVKKAIESNQKLVEALNLYGVILMALGKLPEAIEILMRSVKIKPDYWKPYYNLGNIYLAQQQHQLALRKYITAFNHKKNFLVLERIYAILQTRYFFVIYAVGLIFVFLPFYISKIIAAPLAVVCLIQFMFLTKVSLVNNNKFYAYFNFIFGLVIFFLQIYSIYT